MSIENDTRTKPAVIENRVEELCTKGVRLLSIYHIEEALSCFTKAIYLDPTGKDYQCCLHSFMFTFARICVNVVLLSLM